MYKTSKIIILKKKRLEKKYNKFIRNNKYYIIFLGIPILISSALTIDKYFVKNSLERQGKEYNLYANVDFNYIKNESSEDEYNDIKKYYIYKESIKNYMDERKKDILKY